MLLFICSLRFIRPDTGHCKSDIGRAAFGATKTYFVEEACLKDDKDIAIIKHEILHALGFIHEHTRFEKLFQT